MTGTTGTPESPALAAGTCLSRRGVSPHPGAGLAGLEVTMTSSALARNLARDPRNGGYEADTAGALALARALRALGYRARAWRVRGKDGYRLVTWRRGGAR